MCVKVVLIAMNYAISCCLCSNGDTGQRCTGSPFSWFMSLINKRRRWQTRQRRNSTLYVAYICVCVCVCVCVCLRISNLISSETFLLHKKETIRLWYDISSYSCKFYLLILIRRFRRIAESEFFLRHVNSSVCPHGRVRLTLNAFL